MKMKVTLGNPDSGEVREVVVDVTADEIEKARAHPYPDLCRDAYALRHAYAKVPAGFLHVRDSIEPVWAN
jgi:hypothetical protein